MDLSTYSKTSKNRLEDQIIGLREFLECEYIEKGRYIKIIALDIGCSEQCLSNSMKRLGIKKISKSETSKKVNPKRFDVSKEELQKLYIDQKMSASEIAKIYGYTKRVILIRLRDFGLVRSLSNAQKIHGNKPESKLRSRETMLRLQKSGKIYTFWTDTKPERDFKKWANENNIKIVHQFEFEDFYHRYDFLIEDSKMIVEIDGDYWHSSEKQKKLDRTFEKIAFKKGFSVTRFLQSEIEASKGSCFNKLLNYD